MEGFQPFGPAVQEEVPLNSPYFRAFRAIYSKPVRVEPHYHKELELLFYDNIEGDAFAFGRRHPFRFGEVHHIPPDTVHAFHVNPKPGGSVLVVQLNVNRCMENIADIPGFEPGLFRERLSRVPFSLAVLRPELLRTVLALSPFNERAKQPFESALSDLSAIHTLLSLLLSAGAAVAGPFTKDSRLCRIMEELEKEWNLPFSLDRLSRSSGLSKHHLCRLFHNGTGMTLTDTLSHIRVRKSMEKLASGSNVSETAYFCGFDSVSYFIKIFRRITGFTPKQWAIDRRP